MSYQRDEENLLFCEEVRYAAVSLGEGITL